VCYQLEQSKQNMFINLAGDRQEVAGSALNILIKTV
jgi:hypothetical protein